MDILYSNINDFSNDEIDSFYQKIYKDKKERIDKYKNDITKKRSIIGEILLSRLLEKNNFNYEELSFYTNKDGKPYIKDNPIYFNISHSNDFVVVVISNKEIGIDIEKIRDTNINIINQFCTDKEKEYILNSSNIYKSLFNIYTLKEAYIKMKGTNLSQINNIEFIINKDIICNDKDVSIIQIKDIDNYIISIIENKKET